MHISNRLLLHNFNIRIMTKNKITKRLHDINTFMSTPDNETYLVGKDEYGKDFTMVFNTIELLEWLDKKYMKEQVKKYIKNL